MVSSWKTKIACGIKYCYVKKINVKSAALYVLFCTLLPAFQELGLELPLELLFDVMNKKKRKLLLIQQWSAERNRSCYFKCL